MRGFNNIQGGATALCKLKERRILKKKKKQKQERGAFGVPKDEVLMVKVKSKRSVGYIQLSAFPIWTLYGDECSFSWSVCFAAVEGVLSMEAGCFL